MVANAPKFRGLSPQANYTDRLTSAVGEVVPANAPKGSKKKKKR
jgi:hypothetical protein